MGSHCVLEMPIKKDVRYKFRVALSGSDNVGAHWTGTVTDSSTGKSWVVGTLVYPHFQGHIGFGKVQVHSDDFLEYFVGGDCNAATVGVGIFGPYFNNRSAMPSQAYPSYPDGEHHYKCTVAEPCVPGGMWPASCMDCRWQGHRPR